MTLEISNLKVFWTWAYKRSQWN